MARLEGVIAATRFGMGARPGEIDAASAEPRAWLKAQIRPDAAVIDAAGLRDAAEALSRQREVYRALIGEDADALDDKERREVRQQVQRDARASMAEEVAARTSHASTTKAPFAERWARFWCNHFTVAARNLKLISLVGPFEREAIRPNVFGSFADLLKASTFHPGMLVYLDGADSVGPKSPAGLKREAGLNENLAREVLELHTMGVGSGYSQADIVEFAKALTGWTLAAGGNSAEASGPGGAVFVGRRHEPGARTLLGRTYKADGQSQAPDILDHLARRPETAHHLAVKLVRHFVADQPPAEAVARIEGVLTQSDGDLAEAARAVVDLPQAWEPLQRKLKTPEELLISSARATAGAARPASRNRASTGPRQKTAFQSLAQVPFLAPSPAGWPDMADAWAGADAVKKRLEWANASARRIGSVVDPGDFLDVALGPMASERTRSAVARAESAEQGLTLALMCPEFQRR